MKPIKFLFATMIAVLALVTLPSCSDDNEDEPAVPAAKAIAGTYAPPAVQEPMTTAIYKGDTDKP